MRGERMETLQISLAAARVNAGLTQSDVAKRMRISKQTIVNWENGRIIPKQAQLYMLSSIYKIPQDNIFSPPKLT